MECPDCGEPLIYIEGDAVTRTARYKWVCGNNECLSEYTTDETGVFLDEAND